MEHHFEILVENQNWPAELDQLADYFEEYYIGLRNRGGRGGRRNPLYPRSLWNMTERVLQGLQRTINHLEGWHNRFNAALTSLHPNIWRFIAAVKKQQADNEAEMERLLAGGEPQPQRREYRQLNTRLYNLVHGYQATKDQQEAQAAARIAEINGDPNMNAEDRENGLNAVEAVKTAGRLNYLRGIAYNLSMAV